ncbi:hypothetical protein ACFV30_40415 [Streptomyces sp. NPDC059752]|uniref:hypothetical protein n=1 Tax=unclassified Streptomyces TaxID=2593676 RepID=UPI003663730D
MSISDQGSLGLLNAVLGKAHTAALRGDHTTARQLLTQGRRIFDQAAPTSRPPTMPSPSGAAQDAARVELPVTLPRFATHLEMHRGLMPARSGDTAAGTAHARAAYDALPPEKHSLTLRLLMTAQGACNL